MIVERLLHPGSKLATTRLWHHSTLAEQLAVKDADENDLYGALGWLLARQKRIEKKLAARHLGVGDTVLYDVSSSYYEGRHCPLAAFGHSRDRKKGQPIIVYGVLSDSQGRPLAVHVYPGNTGDPATLPAQVDTLRRRFGLKRVVLVGDRGLWTQTQIDNLRQHPGLGWISALRAPALLAATEKEFERIQAAVARRKRTPLTAAEIARKAGRVQDRYKMGKHFETTIAEGVLSWQRRQAAIQREAELDGIYVIRSSEKKADLKAADAVRSYKSLAHVERVFRCMKGADLRVRPIFHRTPDHVRAHIFLCLLAYYVEWRMRQAWAELLFEDEQLEAGRQQRDPVAPAEPSAAVKKKKARRLTSGGLPVHSFATLLEALATRCQNTCRVVAEGGAGTFKQRTAPTPLQKRAFELLGL